MSNGLASNYKKTGTPVTIAPKTSSSSINRKACRQWLGIRKFRKQLLYISETIHKGGEKECKFQEQEEAEGAAAEHWEKE